MITPCNALVRTFGLAGAAVAVISLAGCGSLSHPAAPNDVRHGSNLLNFTATMSAGDEVPPKPSAGTGVLTAQLDKATHLLSWKMSYTGLTGPATMAHLHGPASPGVNAGVVVPFANPSSPSEGSSTITPVQAADLVAGKWYVNVHTQAHPGGEIRGQLTVK